MKQKRMQEKIEKKRAREEMSTCDEIVYYLKYVFGVLFFVFLLYMRAFKGKLVKGYM